jgi:hypothetical protein
LGFERSGPTNVLQRGLQTVSSPALASREVAWWPRLTTPARESSFAGGEKPGTRPG